MCTLARKILVALDDTISDSELCFRLEILTPESTRHDIDRAIAGLLNNRMIFVCRASGVQMYGKI